MSTYKAVAQARELQSILEKRLTGCTVTESFTDPVPGSINPHGSPVLTIKKGTDTVALVRVSGIETPLNRDVLGLEQRVYTPHKIALVFTAEEDGDDPDLNVVGNLDLLFPLVCDLALTGMAVEVYKSAATPVLGDIVPENRIVQYQSHLYWGVLSSM